MTELSLDVCRIIIEFVPIEKGVFSWFLVCRNIYKLFKSRIVTYSDKKQQEVYISFKKNEIPLLNYHRKKYPKLTNEKYFHCINSQEIQDLICLVGIVKGMEMNINVKDMCSNGTKSGYVFCCKCISNITFTKMSTNNKLFTLHSDRLLKLFQSCGDEIRIRCQKKTYYGDRLGFEIYDNSGKKHNHNDVMTIKIMDLSKNVLLHTHMDRIVL